MNMSIYNYLLMRTICPWCFEESDVRAQFRFGLRDLREYRIGDRLEWKGRGVRTPRLRPPGGDFDSEAYVECPKCGREFWLQVTIRGDVIRSAIVDVDRDDYPLPE